MNKCPNCGFENLGEHWNSESLLPPVNLPFLILKEGKELLVLRSEYASSSSGNLTYGLMFDKGTPARGVVVGRFPWRHV